ncbi:hypothetical protein D0C16_17375 [Cellvibrio sp. KY-GH-1]|uniref:contractile injection system tape measure protein n=1 Tax=Cellvibrio sp. KY-GH-1 TaxID=2303332 RepID=UPI001245697F|nr:contractile injection system tape measure protein [Cellvibrio sp. KY-GH-1]QEY17602.1 hypothetical protein D0C16_17375 [Cellvibrio sp. KY-GH-1]
MQARQLPSAAFRQTHHCIDDIAVDLVFGSRQLEQRERATIARWLSDELLPALDELFSFYAPGEQIIRFEQLVFDFGHLPASDYRQIIREQLVQKLTQLIKAQSLPLHTEQRENLVVNRVTESGAALTLLLDYLRTGQLTAQQLRIHSDIAPAKFSGLHQQLLESLLAEQHIATGLRALPNRGELIARLIKQFSERHRTELLRQLAPQQLDIALALLDIWQTSAAHTSAEQVQTLWQCILQLALAQPELAPARWLQSVMHEWRELAPLQAHAFIQTVQNASWAKTAFASSNAPASWLQLQTQLNVLLQENPDSNNTATSLATNYNEQPAARVTLAPPLGSSTMPDSPSDAQSSPVQSRQEQTASAQSLTVQQQLAQALIRGDAVQLENHWNHWQAQHAQILISGLKHYLVNAELRQQLVLKLPVPLLHALLRLLAPDLAPLLQSIAQRAHNYLAVIEQLESTNPVDEMHGQRPGAPVREWQRHLYEIMASLIFTGSVDDSAEPIAVPSLAKFFSELVFHVAAQREIPARELHRQWQQILQSDAHASNSNFIDSDATEFVAQASATQHAASDRLASSAPVLDKLALDKPALESLELNNPPADSIADNLLLAEFQMPEVKAPGSENTNPLNNDASTTKLLLKKIHGAFAQASARELENLWPQIIAVSGPEIITALRRYWAIASIRQQLLPRLTVTSIQRLLVLIAPAYQALLEKIVNASAQLRQEAISLQIDSISDNSNPMGSVQELGHQPDGVGAVGGIAPGGKAQAATTEAWLREAYAIISALVFGSSSASADTIFTAALTGAESNGLAPNASQSDDSARIAPAELVQQFTRHYAQTYQLPVAALGFLWSNLLESGVATTPAVSFAAATKFPATSSATSSFGSENVSAARAAASPTPNVSSTLNVSSTHNAAPTSDAAQTFNAASTISAAPANAVAVDVLLQHSAQELFEWCLQLKHNHQLRAQLPAHEALMARLIDSFVKLSPNFSPEFRQYFLLALDEQASAQINRATFFRQVLLGLVDDELIDLDVIAAENPGTTTSDSMATSATDIDAQTTPGRAPMHEAQHQSPLHQTANAINSVDQHAAPARSPLPAAQAGLDAEQQTRQRLAQLVQELRAGRIDPFGLRMSLYYWQRLVEQSLTAKGGDSSHHTELREAIGRSGSDATDPNYFYQQVIHALLADLPLDMEAFARGTAADHHARETESAKHHDDAILHEHSSAQATKKIEPTFTSVSIDKQSLEAVAPGDNDFHDAAQSFPDATGTDTEPSGNGDMLRTPELTLEQLLREPTTLTTQQMQQLQQHVNLLLQHFSQAQAQEWLRILREPACAQRLIQQVPGHLLHQIVQRLQAGPFAALDPIVKLASEALALLLPGADPLLLKQARWEFVFGRLFGSTNPMDAAQLLQACCEQLAQTLGVSDSQRLLQLAERRLALLKPVAAARPSMSLNDGNTSEEPVLNFEAGVHLNNVGMVLASPFLPRLFSMFNLLEDGKFIHPGAADRAAHLLQYMVTGQSETPEYELTLNKILCGISTSMPISAGIEVTEQEKQVIEQMLQSMIQHWKALGSTSVAGLRETFMQRQGWLILDEDYWRLKVQERTFDMLLDRLPWNISMIKHAWMDRPLRVSWREQS